MPRVNSQNAAVNDIVGPDVVNDINLDLDTLFSLGSDRGRVYAALSGSPLKVDIGSFSYRVGASSGIYAGATDVVVANNVTNYIEMNTAGSVSVNSSGWDGQKARLATVVTSAGVITSINIYKPDVIGGSLGGTTGLQSVTSIVKDKFGRITQFLADGITYTLTYIGISFRIKSVTNGSVTVTINYDVNFNFVNTTVT
jgi:hypothetical protein